MTAGSIAPTPVGIGDKIVAGHLELELSDALPNAPGVQKVEFVEVSESATAGSTTLVASLDEMLSAQSGEMDKTSIIQGNPQMQALIRAGRELAGHRPLNELFEVIMDLSMEAVLAGRGVLMTLEGDELKARAARGAGFKISNTVRDRVIKEKSSLLVRDAQMDHALKAQMSIVQKSVRSMIAVPLQTNDRVIGLIYVDSPDMIREFTREDLGLLTVMANVAAIRIEHARLNEIELVERAMSKELDQAAHIQMGLLPSSSAESGRHGHLRGSTAPCRTVGGDYYDYLEFPDGAYWHAGGRRGRQRHAGIAADVELAGARESSVRRRRPPGGENHAAEQGDHRAHARQPVHHVLHDGGGPGYRRTGVHQRGTQSAGAGARERRVRAADGRRHDSGHSPDGAIRGGSASRWSAGDTLVLFSDGVTEAVNPSDEDFGEQRLADLVASMKGQLGSRNRGGGA